jgi:hypothetical protein
MKIRKEKAYKTYSSANFSDTDEEADDFQDPFEGWE